MIPEKRYKRKDPIYTVSQFTRDCDFYIKIDRCSYLHTYFHPGDWFLRDQFGIETKMTDSEFKKYFEEIKE